MHTVAVDAGHPLRHRRHAARLGRPPRPRLAGGVPRVREGHPLRVVRVADRQGRGPAAPGLPLPRRAGRVRQGDRAVAQRLVEASVHARGEAVPARAAALRGAAWARLDAGARLVGQGGRAGVLRPGARGGRPHRRARRARTTSPGASRTRTSSPPRSTACPPGSDRAPGSWAIHRGTGSRRPSSVFRSWVSGAAAFPRPSSGRRALGRSSTGRRTSSPTWTSRPSTTAARSSPASAGTGR